MKKEGTLTLLFRILFITGGDFGAGEDDVRDGLTILGVLFRLEEALHGDAVALDQNIEVCSILVASPYLNVEDGACTLLLVILALSADDCQAEAGY